jgi:hypothetical protein
MTRWLPVLAGVVAAIGSAVAALANSPPSLLVAGFLGGVAAGVIVGSVRSGLWHGLLVGVDELLLVVSLLVVALVLYDPQYARPGIGYAIVLVPALGVAYVVEAVVGGAIGGVLGRALQ